MKKLNLVNLYKSEIKKNLLAQVKGGIDVRCNCSISNPMVSVKQQGPSGELCACGASTTSSATAQASPSIF
jgi:hypothetical protein